MHEGGNAIILNRRVVVAKLTIIVKKNAGYEKGDYGYSVHEEGVAGMSANVVPTDEAGLKKMLKEYGCSDDYAKAVIDRLQKTLDSEKIVVEKKS